MKGLKLQESNLDNICQILFSAYLKIKVEKVFFIAIIADFKVAFVSSFW